MGARVYLTVGKSGMRIPLWNRPGGPVDSVWPSVGSELSELGGITTTSHREGRFGAGWVRDCSPDCI